MINLKIDGVSVSVNEGTTILEAAREVGIVIPTLCYLKSINEIGACRVCVVEIKNGRGLVTACVQPVAEGMEVITSSKKVLDSRRKTLELILSDHNKSCLSCVRNGNCELAKLATEFGCDTRNYIGRTNVSPIDNSSCYLVRDNSKCVLCQRCTSMCKDVQEVGVIKNLSRGFKTHVGCAFEQSLSEVACTACGQCINVCPTGALSEKDDINKVVEALNDKSKHVVVATAPAVRVALGEEFGFPIGTNVEGKMVTALNRTGFAKVFDVDFSADLTIMEEAYEFISRVQNGGVLPMITSCSPGWVKYLESQFPKLIPNLSSCKSPNQMLGAIIKTYYAEKNKIDPKDIIYVSVMPCTAKKFEITRNDQAASGFKDVDIVLTTRELARLIKRKGIALEKLPNSEFDNPLGIGSGAGLIFGVTGGVMEAALRTAYEVLSKKSLDKLELTPVRGFDGIKEAKFDINGLEIKVAVASGLTNAKLLCEKISCGEADYHFIEIMCCPGGCINGGGQPIVSAEIRNTVDYRSLRANALYSTDQKMTLRKSHENPYINELYKDYLGEPNSHKAHHILHTKYEEKSKN